jgi:site-specific recombinase XerD
MKKHFQTDPGIMDRYRFGPLGLHLGSFANWLSEQGYPRQTGMQKLRLFAILSCWLEQKKITLQQLDEQRIDQFIKTQRKQLRRQRQVRHTLIQLLHHLRRLRVAPDPQPPQAKSPADRLMHDYEQFLAQERGLSQVTLDSYLPAVRRFLVHAFGTKALRLNQLEAGTINRFILRDKSTFSPKRVQLTTSALRSFFGFL